MTAPASRTPEPVTTLVRMPLAPPCHPWIRCTGSPERVWCPICDQEYLTDDDRLIAMQDLQAGVLNRHAARSSGAVECRDARLTMVVADFPGWQVWAANGHVYGTRRGRLSDAEWRAGLAATVHAGSVEGLREALANQSQISAELAGRDPSPVRGEWEQTRTAVDDRDRNAPIAAQTRLTAAARK